MEKLGYEPRFCGAKPLRRLTASFIRSRCVIVIHDIMHSKGNLSKRVELIMARILDWIKERENSFFLTHLLAVLVLAILVEQLASGWTTYSFPALILLSAASFMWNYPVKAIKFTASSPST